MSKRGRYNSYTDRTPRGYDRGFTQRHYKYENRKKSGMKRRGKSFIPGYDRNVGYYGRYNGPGYEKKFKDESMANDAITPTMVITNLSVIAQGTNESERIGRRITIRNIHLKGAVHLASTAQITQTADVVRLMIVQDTQTNGVQMTALNLLETDTIFSFRNLANSSRFKILWAKDLNVASKCGASLIAGDVQNYGEERRYVKANIKTNIVIEYDLNTGAIGTVKSNNLYFVTQSQDGHCFFTGQVRLRYSDK